ncbi:hypothetical protein H9P43_006856 [Blastocladiella emersonii ATCC 22665]|nr:hypothetical protein H9P43_006856 [Blastocladiella emersonii ATCC 22665]
MLRVMKIQNKSALKKQSLYENRMTGLYSSPSVVPVSFKPPPRKIMDLPKIKTAQVKW